MPGSFDKLTKREAVQSEAVGNITYPADRHTLTPQPALTSYIFS